MKERNANPKNPGVAILTVRCIGTPDIALAQGNALKIYKKRRVESHTPVSFRDLFFNERFV